MKIEVKLYKGEVQSLIDSISTELDLIEVIPESWVDKKKVTNRYNDLINLRNKLEDYIV